MESPFVYKLNIKIWKRELTKEFSNIVILKYIYFGFPAFPIGVIKK